MALSAVTLAFCATGLVLADAAIRFQRQADNGCRTARGEPGICLNIRQCPPMVELLKNGRNNRTAVDYLRRSMCGYEGNDPMVCCPNFTPGGGGGNIGTREPVDSIRTGTISALPSPPNCGRSALIDLPRIVGGRPAELGSWPWMAALGYKARRGDTSKIQWLCGGALITDRYIVTAAHCLFHPSLILTKVRLGDLDLNNNIADGASPIEVNIEKQIGHEKYSKTKYTDDIALLRLESSVQFTKLIQPICIPKAPELRSNNFVRYNPFAAGWGSLQFKGPSSTHLQEIQLPVLENSKCEEAFKPKGAEIIGRQLCAGYLTGGKDACQGDSGGPLMLPKGETFYLIGVVSFGYRCAEKGYPGVYTRVTEYVDWISKNIQN